jgi:hypothetical protein
MIVNVQALAGRGCGGDAQNDSVNANTNTDGTNGGGGLY